MKTVLITGAHGQDGIILSKIFLKKKYKVFGIVRKKSKKLIPRIKYIVNNLSSRKKIDKILIKTDPSIIIHLAAINNSYYLRKKENFKNNYLLNLICSKNLIDSAVKINNLKKFIFAGSSLMFKNQKNIKVNENSSFKSKDYYSKYKIEIYRYLEKISKKNNFNSTTVLLFNHDSIYRNEKFLIPRLIKSFIKKDKNFIEKVFSLNISGDFSNAEDICHGIYKLSVSKEKIPKIILSSGKRLFINDIIDFLIQKFSFKINKNLKMSKNNYKHIGSNKLARKLINYNNKGNFLNVVKKILKKNKN